MKTRTQALTAATLLALAIGGCSSMTHQEKSTVAGAVGGGVAGSAMTGGSTAGSLGGAAVGGVIGHQVGR